MKSIIIGGLAAGALTALLCTSKVGLYIQDAIESLMIQHGSPRALREHVSSLLACSFCSSWWVSIAMLEKFSVLEWAATVAVANIAILLIHWSLSTTEESE